MQKESKTEYIKRATLEIYDSLPKDKHERMKCTDARDKIIDLNYSFFGYVATSTFINNSSITYEDKLQSALMHFCECWWWYKWDGTGDPKHKGYRQDLSFTVFFKPRIGEMIERELNEVKYSTRRDLLMLAGAQLGKHWGKVTYDDLKLVKLPAEKMDSLKAIFGSMYIADLETHALFIKDDSVHTDILDTIDDNYDTLEEFLIKEMVDNEKMLTHDDLVSISNKFNIPLSDIRKANESAKETLYNNLKASIEMRDAFSE